MTTQSPASPPPVDPRQAVQTPAVLLMVTGGIGMLLALLGMVRGQPSAADLSSIPDAQAREIATKVLGAMGSLGIASSVLGLVVSGLIIFGAIKMKNLQSFGLAMTAAILSLIPCFGCYCFGIPVGIWALVVLNKTEVKAAFQ